MNPLIWVEAVVGTLIPLFLGSVAAVHQLRGGKPDLGESVRITTRIWLGLCLATAAMAIALAELGLGA